MNHCEEVRAQIVFYLDDELQSAERAVLETHLRDCDACREILNTERRFLDTIRPSRPLHAAPIKLRERVEQLLSSAPVPHSAPPELRNRIRSLWILGSASGSRANW